MLIVCGLVYSEALPGRKYEWTGFIWTFLFWNPVVPLAGLARKEPSVINMDCSLQ